MSLCCMRVLSHAYVPVKQCINTELVVNLEEQVSYVCGDSYLHYLSKCVMRLRGEQFRIIRGPCVERGGGVEVGVMPRGKSERLNL